MTNQEYAVLSYIRRVVDWNVMDSLFLDAFYSIMGATLCMALTGDKALANMQIQLANSRVAEARKADANEGLTINDVTPDWIRTRGIIYGDYWNMGFGYGWDTVGLWPIY
jgi:hypothetical protein